VCGKTGVVQRSCVFFPLAGRIPPYNQLDTLLISDLNLAVTSMVSKEVEMSHSFIYFIIILSFIHHTIHSSKFNSFCNIFVFCTDMNDLNSLDINPPINGNLYGGKFLVENLYHYSN